jgi:signal transduction histidine kinase/HPt (histidine-containing phosphotransfer) domain-containing protein
LPPAITSEEVAPFRSWQHSFALGQCRILVVVTLAGLLVGLFLPLGNSIEDAPNWLIVERAAYGVVYVVLLAILAIRPGWPVLRAIAVLVPAMTFGHLALLAALRPEALGAIFATSLVAGVFFAVLTLPGYRAITLLRNAQLSFLVVLDFVAEEHALPLGWALWAALAALTSLFCHLLARRQHAERLRQFRVARELESTRRALAERVEELARANAAIVVERDRAREADSAKSRLLAMVSHELRTPMTGVLGALELLDGHVADEDGRRLTQLARGSAHSLLGLIDSLLEVAGRGEEATGSDGPVDLPVAVERITTLVRALAAARGVRFDVQATADPGTWLRGAAGLERILFALLENAVKFTPAGGSVRLMASLDDATTPGAGGSLRLVVEDTGIGIAPEHLDQIFEPFTQADEGISRRFGGTGLGLAICRDLVARAGGRISVASTPGEGSRFDVALPVTRAEVPVPPAPVPSDAPRRVLLVDDDPVNRMIGEGMLRRLGHHVRVAEGGEEAIGLLSAGEGFDAVLLDIRMPGLDGLQTAEAVQDGVAIARRPVPLLLAVTADVTPANRAAAEAAGFKAVLPKPYTLRDLAAALGTGELPGAGPESPSPPGPSLLALDHLRSTTATLGSAFLDSLLQEYRRSAASILEALPRAEPAEARRLAHQLASAAASIGFPQLRARAADLSRSGPVEDDLRDLLALHQASLHAFEDWSAGASDRLAIPYRE